MGEDNVKENRAWHARGGRKKKGRWILAYIGYCDGASFGGVMMMGMTMWMMMGMMMGILFSRSVDIHVDKCLRFCRGVPKFCGTRSSVYRHAVKGILMTISSILAVQLKFFYGVSERHHVLYWISLCDVFRMCFCYLLDRNLFLYSYDIVKLLCILYFTLFTTLVNSW